jgi:uncharacterized membrane protein
MTYLVWGFVLVMIGMALIDPIEDIVRHLVWRRRWKRDDMGTYRRYLSELERLQAEPPKVCRTKRQEAGKSDG